MQLPQFTVSAETLHDEYGLYHLTRLQADPSLGELQEAFTVAQAALKAKLDALKAAEVAAMAAMAIRNEADDALDDAVRVFSLAVLAKVTNDREAPLYKAYFPEPMSVIIRSPLIDELQKVGLLLATLSTETDATLAAHTPTLQAAYDTLAKAVEAHKAALEATIQARGLLEREKLDWFDAYKKSYRELGRLYYQDMDKAEAFFKPSSKRGKTPEPAPPVV